MKSKERHKLKTNELAESIQEISVFLRQHGSRILAGAVMALVVVVGILWYLNVGASAQSERAERLQSLTVSSDQMQWEAAQRGRMEEDSEESLVEESYNSANLVSSLGELARQEAGSEVGMMSLLRQAEAIRSEMYFSDREFSVEEKEQLTEKAEKVYERVILEYSPNPSAFGAARLGLGLLAEDSGDWAGAKEIYESITAEEKGRFAGTVFGLQARKRLEILDKINIVIEFASAPAEVILETGGEAAQESQAQLPE